MLRILIAVVVLVFVVYLVGTRAITSITSVGEGAGERAGGRKLGYSPFKITFRDQYLCYSYDAADWVMRGHRTDEDCKGPFIDSVSLCNAMAEESVTRVKLYWEGRVLECS